MLALAAYSETLHSSAIRTASGILISRGYELTALITDSAYEYVFQRKSDGIVVELRWSLADSEFRRDWDMDWLWPRRQTSILLGMPIPVFSPEQTLILRCLHGSKHGWSCLIWIRDVAQLLRVRPDLAGSGQFGRPSACLCGGLWR